MAERSVMLKIEGLKKFYQMGDTTVKALDGVDLNVKSNDFIAIMGTSGSGKSTFMNILGCLDTPSEGSYLLNGTEVSNMSDDELADIRNRKLGFIFQSFHLLPRYSALKNVALPLFYSDSYEESFAKAEEMLEMVGLGDRMDHKPTELSGGQRQRVAIARALINKPDIILADEPTGNLDTATTYEIMDILQKLHSKGQTIIMVTHEPDIAEYANTVITMKDGRIVDEKSNI